MKRSVFALHLLTMFFGAHGDVKSQARSDVPFASTGSMLWQGNGTWNVPTTLATGDGADGWATFDAGRCGMSCAGREQQRTAVLH